MGNKHSVVEWLLNADICRKMAERVSDSGRKIAWLNLARQWLLLGDSNELQTKARPLVDDIQDEDTGDSHSRQ